MSANLYGAMSKMTQGFFQLCQCSRGVGIAQLAVGAGKKMHRVRMALQYLAAAALGKVKKLVKIIPPEQHGAASAPAVARSPNGVRISQQQQGGKALSAEKRLVAGQKKAGL